MPGLARKLIVIAAIDGLIIQPLSSKGQRPSSPVKISYGDSTLSPVTKDLTADMARPNSSFEAFGVIGMINVSRLPFLITITRRRQVAQIRGYPIYVVTEVAITPCATYEETEQAVAKTKLGLELPTDRTPEATSDISSDSSDSEDEVQIPLSDEVEDLSSPETERVPVTMPNGLNGNDPEIAKNVIKRKGSYGRFASGWFSRGGWMMEQKRTLGMSTNSSSGGPLEFEEPDGSVQDTSQPRESSTDYSDGKPAPHRVTSLLPKLLKTTEIMFGTSRSFYYSYEWDLTRSLSSQHETKVDGEQELSKKVDPMFFWNRHMLHPFMDGGYDGLALPMIQGFVGQRGFVMDSQPPQMDEPGAESVELAPLSPPGSPPPERASLDLRPTEKRFLLTLISRRSVRRAGLRYLRRGVNEEGFVANSVETEQLLAPSCWGELDARSKTYSFLQCRGSIPSYFTQTPYSLKPVPVLKHSDETNFKAFRKHMGWVKQRFDKVQLVNLVEKTGIEAAIGERYRDMVARLNMEEGQEEIPFEWFDFHHACRGMKFENVSILLQTLSSQLDSYGSAVEMGGELIRAQKGIVRTNCMDCLDRTNVVQSSMAKYMFDKQLRAQGFDVDEQKDQDMLWYNSLWADNGDNISKQYASTAALKGDFTRHKKRDYRGKFTDMGLSLTRFYNGIVNDDFSQAAIDFYLGTVTCQIFHDFEASLKTPDPAISLPKMREQAIDMCQSQLPSENEDFVSGWTLLAPPPAAAAAYDGSPASLLSYSATSTPMEEVVLLLTDAAVYVCRFDWNMDKISSFERIDLSHIVGLRTGTYVTTSALVAEQGRHEADEMRNVGLVVEYKPGKNDVKRVNTRSLSSLADAAAAAAAAAQKVEVELEEDVGVMDGLAGILERAGISTAVSSGKGNGSAGGGGAGAGVRRVPLKAPYTLSSSAHPRGERVGMLTEVQMVGSLCSEIERLALKAGGGRGEGKGFVVRGDIVGLEEARRNVGIFDQLGHSIKKMVWAS